MLAPQYLFDLLGGTTPDFPNYTDYDDLAPPVNGLTALISLLALVIVVGGIVAFVFFGRGSDKKQQKERKRPDWADEQTD